MDDLPLQGVSRIKNSLEQEETTSKGKRFLTVLPRDGEVVYGLLLNPFLPHVVYYNIIKAFENRSSDLHRK